MSISQAERARQLGISPAALCKRIKKHGRAAVMGDALPREAPRMIAVPDYQTAAEQRAAMWPERNSGDRFRPGATAAEVAAALAKR
jgi:hypothetical protein